MVNRVLVEFQYNPIGEASDMSEKHTVCEKWFLGLCVNVTGTNIVSTSHEPKRITENCMKPKYFGGFEKVIQLTFNGAYETSELGELIDELQIYLVVYTVTNR